MQQSPKSLFTPIQRIRFWYALLLVVFGIFVIRLFYLQIIRHDYYQKEALRGQFKDYEIPAERGIIEVHNGRGVTPIVLNEIKYTLVADPKFIKEPAKTATAVEKVIGGKASDYEEKMKADSRYAVLAKKLSKEQKQQIEELKLKGIIARETVYRTYPQGTLAAQLLGFVNDEGAGKYGIEQALNDDLKGKPGQLKAITDAEGVPLAANKDNMIVEPEKGKRVVLTIDLGMQQQLEDILKTGIENAKSESGGALIIDPYTGAIKAMANFPTYNPAEFFNVESKDIGRFENSLVSSPLEIGSVMKPLTAAAALNIGVVNRNTGYYDPSFFVVDGYKITNIEEVGGAAQKSVPLILQQSLNTGATWLLMQMGGGEINEKARLAWHDYMVNHYGFGKLTGVEQGYESAGSIPDPKDGFGLNIQYANTAFGQGMTATPLQLAAAVSSVINGGKYYRPHLVEKYVDGSGKEKIKTPEVLRDNVVSASVGKDIKELMESVFDRNHAVYGMPKKRPEFSIGAKTGTAQVANREPGGRGYYEDRFNGMFVGFVGGDRPEYVIVVRVNEPKIAGYAGSKAAGPIFVSIANTLIDNFGVSPKSTR